LTSHTEYSKVFNQLCHMVALSKDSKLKPAVDNLVTTVLAIDDDNLSAAAQVVGAIDAYFGLSLSELLVQSSIDRNITSGRLQRESTSRALVLPLQVKAEIESRVAEADALEQSVREEWLESVEELIHTDSADWDEQLWKCLRAYMAKAFQRHGVETVQLLNPSSPLDNRDRKHMATYLEEAIRQHCRDVPREVASAAVQEFFSVSTPQRTKYIAQLLDGTFTFFALTVDQATSSYLQGNVGSLALFLDTNFIFDILGLHSNPLTEFSQELVEVVRKHGFPFKLYYHEETLEELQRTLQAKGDSLRRRTWPTALSRAAVKQGHLSGIELLYHKKNAESPLDPDVFLSRYEHIPELLSEHGFVLYPKAKTNESEDYDRHLLVAEYQEYLEGTRRGRPKSYKVINHDMAVWQTVKGLRRRDASALDAGAFFITTDYYLYTFDWQHLREQSKLGFVVLPNQFLQLLRPFVPSTDDFDRRFVETFAIPEFRSVENDYSSTHSKVLSYLSTYSDISERTAVSILANEMLMQEIQEVPEESKQFGDFIESALAHDNEQLQEANERLLEERQEARQSAEENEALARQREEQIRQSEEDRANFEARLRELEQKGTETAKTVRSLREESRMQSQQLNSTQGQLERSRFMQRLLSASLVALAGIGILVTASVASWPWLERHPNKLGLYGSVIAIICGGVWAVVDSKRRSLALGALGIGAFLVLLQLVSS
jgi:hypothetical protein